MNYKTSEKCHGLPDPATALPESSHLSLGRMVSRWAERAPGSLAACQGAHGWTYAELVSTAEALAASLPAGEVIAVTGQQSFGLVAAALAVLSSRSVLLTVDPKMPERRQKLIVEQAGARRVLAVGEPPQWMREREWDEVVTVEPDRVMARREAAVLQEPLPDDPAYIFFTSGSTGIPKGVLGCHKGLSHFLAWQSEEFQVGKNDRVAQLTNLSFDPLLRSMFLALVSGGTLCLPEESTTLAADGVLPWMQKSAITLLHVVPSLALSWLGSVPAGCTLPNLRAVFFAGEPLHESLVRRWRAKFPSSEIVNLYGPTETTMAKFFYRVPAEPDAGIQPVGWPLPETQGLVLDEQNALCVMREAGEIVIRTPFRSLGYINAPEEQEKRFLRNPFRDDPSDLVYRTGDRGRYRADGALEILGRLDFQVKIQGVRVEPEEVSATILRHPGVQACVVIARPDASERLTLIAYVVAPGLSAEQLRGFLSTELPAAIIPSSFVFLERLPLNPNGKVDRGALPAVAVTRSFTAPRTQLEQQLAAVWKDVLGVDKVGLEDNFFELGGNSIGLAQVHAKLKPLVNRDIPITDLFQYPTVRALADHLTPKTPQTSARMTARERAARQIAARSGLLTMEEEEDTEQ
ncbi:MAG TPA: non-ribosomal peptide synthetase [Bryobacteraceae bacterium]|nr:non-ribosomal peptide synthetase [Bryobacteraceae bacterium]